MLELTESQINGRFRIYDSPQAAPGKCSVCGSVERAVVDFGLDVDGYGAVVFCVECLKSAAQLLDMVPGRDLRVAQLVQRAHKQEIMEAGDITSEYTRRFSDLNAEFSDRLRGVSSPAPIEVGTLDGSDDSSAAKKLSVDAGQFDSTSVEGSRSTINEGPDSVSSSSGNGTFQL